MVDQERVAVEPDDSPVETGVATSPSAPGRSGRTGATRAEHTSISWVGWMGITLAVLLVVAMALLNLVKAPYVILRPGPAYNALGTMEDGTPMIQVDGAPVYPGGGDLDFTTVSMSGGPAYPITWIDYFEAKADSQAQILPESAIFSSDDTAESVEKRSIAEMQGSQQAAAAVALRTLGRTVTQRVQVVEVREGSQAAQVLRADDVIVSVAGRSVKQVSQVEAVLAKQPKNEPVTLEIRRGGETLEVETQLAAEGEEPQVVLTTHFASPVGVTIHPGEVGGPSAGLMFSLAVYEVLTPGAMAQGRDIAGTGTIAPDGAVRPIGSVEHKMAGAMRAGAEFFLLPDANCEQAVGAVPDGMTIVPVTDFREAVDVVLSIGRDDLSSLPQCPA